jgi:histone acetyltransferase (RNA polymerase elongator complex component)
MNKNLIYPLFIPMQGCPRRCVYCDQSKISGAGTFEFETARDEVRAFIRRNPNREKEIAFYGGSFTALSQGERERILAGIAEVIDDNTSIRISTHPLYIDDAILDHCARYRVRTIELGIQDFNGAVLDASGRGYSGEDALKACRMVQQRGIRLGVQLMPGLPGSSEETIAENHAALKNILPAFLRLYPLVVIRDTPLADEYRRGKYQPLLLDEAIRICADYARLCEIAGIRIIKYGLPSNLGSDEVLGGPWHPAFGELVKQEILIRKLRGDPSRLADLNNAQLQLLRAHGCRFLDDNRHEYYPINPSDSAS